MNDYGNLTSERPPFLPVLIATGLGSGFWPWGPGTAGSVAATLVWLLLTLLPLPAAALGSIMFLLVVAFTILGTWATARLQPYWGDDPSRVVIDEWVGMWIPLSLLSAADRPWALAALVLFRFFDIVKPLGIKALDRRKGAFWVMADDLLGGVYAAAALVLVRIALVLIGV